MKPHRRPPSKKRNRARALTDNLVAVLVVLSRGPAQPRDVVAAVWPQALSDSPARIALARLRSRGLVRTFAKPTGTFVRGGGNQHGLTLRGREALEAASAAASRRST